MQVCVSVHVQEARQALEAAEAVAKETGARVKALRAAAGSAQELAAASRRRVVALEADKKAAAAARVCSPSTFVSSTFATLLLHIRSCNNSEKRRLVMWVKLQRSWQPVAAALWSAPSIFFIPDCPAHADM